MAKPKHYTVTELHDMETLNVGQHEDLKVDEGDGYRVWFSRLEAGDGSAPKTVDKSHMVRVEKLVKVDDPREGEMLIDMGDGSYGRWVDEECYQAEDDRSREVKAEGPAAREHENDWNAAEGKFTQPQRNA